MDKERELHFVASPADGFVLDDLDRLETEGLHFCKVRAGVFDS